MWDPISIFFCMWVLNIGMPEARLSVKGIIEYKEQYVINKAIIDSATIREEYYGCFKSH